MPDSLFQKIYTIVARIPKGKVATYGQIAAMAGHAGAARTVGWAMSACPEGLPWHRVINAQGRSSFPEERKRHLQMSLLESEGLIFDYPGRLDLDKYLWDGD
jgi:methylated-DNA-protein-cysteine methyltransferase-like protein